MPDVGVGSKESIWDSIFKFCIAAFYSLSDFSTKKKSTKKNLVFLKVCTTKNWFYHSRTLILLKIINFREIRWYEININALTKWLPIDINMVVKIVLKVENHFYIFILAKMIKTAKNDREQPLSTIFNNDSQSLEKSVDCTREPRGISQRMFNRCGLKAVENGCNYRPRPPIHIIFYETIDLLKS